MTTKGEKSIKRIDTKEGFVHRWTSSGEARDVLSAALAHQPHCGRIYERLQASDLNYFRTFNSLPQNFTMDRGIFYSSREKAHESCALFVGMIGTQPSDKLPLLAHFFNSFVLIFYYAVRRSDAPIFTLGW
jgi:hypothetical protein